MSFAGASPAVVAAGAADAAAVAAAVVAAAGLICLHTPCCTRLC